MRQAPYIVPDSKRIRVIIDTDCHCEANDQYAVAHQLMTPKFDVVGIAAEHYALAFGEPSVAASMQASFNEAQLIVDLMGLHDKVKVYKGCAEQLKDEKTPVDSEASRFIIEEAMKEDPRPLFITVQGALTNLASAYLIEPKIAERVTAIWVGGGMYPEGGSEFNARNDCNAANVIMDSEIELWQVPLSVYRTMKVSFATLYEKVRPYGKLGEHLFDYMTEFNHKFVGHMVYPASMSAGERCTAFPGGESWQLGDSVVIGLMLTDHEGHYTIEGAPRFEVGSCKYILRPNNQRKIRVYHYIDTTFILEDFFSKIKYYFGK